MSNIGLKLESTGNNYNKLENMWNYFSAKIRKKSGIRTASN